MVAVHSQVMDGRILKSAAMDGCFLIFAFTDERKSIVEAQPGMVVSCSRRSRTNAKAKLPIGRRAAPMELLQ
jgi:hypothetical protein